MSLHPLIHQNKWGKVKRQNRQEKTINSTGKDKITIISRGKDKLIPTKSDPQTFQKDNKIRSEYQ